MAIATPRRCHPRLYGRVGASAMFRPGAGGEGRRQEVTKKKKKRKHSMKERRENRTIITVGVARHAGTKLKRNVRRRP